MDHIEKIVDLMLARLGDTVETVAKRLVAAHAAELDVKLEQGLARGLAGLPAPQQGEKGEKGDRGEKGERGADGAPGIGERGPQGERGEKGETGERGPDGPRGEKGDRGERGEKGEKGDPGEIPPGLLERALEDIEKRLEARIEFAVAKAVAALPPPPRGEKGERGEPGPEGKPGRDGRDGRDGDKGEKGDPGLDGKDGRDGMRGEQGPEGKQGPKGDRGEDGRHGLNADPFSDFDVELDADDPQIVTFTFRSETESTSRSLRLPIMVDTGIYRRGVAYRRGQCVTFGGQIFVAQRDTQDEPLKSQDWRLAVKRGRDGKDAGEGGAE